LGALKEAFTATTANNPGKTEISPRFFQAMAGIHPSGRRGWLRDLAHVCDVPHEIRRHGESHQRSRAINLLNSSSRSLRTGYVIKSVRVSPPESFSLSSQ
jgi:hypothetical protein